MKVIDVSIHLTKTKQLSDLLKADKIVLHLDILGEVGDNIECYSKKYVEQMLND